MAKLCKPNVNFQRPVAQADTHADRAFGLRYLTSIIYPVAAGSVSPRRILSSLVVYVCLLLAVSTMITSNASAIDDDAVPIIDLGDEYSSYKKPAPAAKRTKRSKSSTLPYQIAMYIPNRVLDILDILRVDVGVGPAIGGVVRFSKDGQLAYRKQLPGSLHLGLRGRNSPLFIEKRDEIGVSPSFSQSKDRPVAPAEFGAGIDVGLLSIYGGLDLGSIGDCLLGFVGVDLANDDI